MDSLKVPIKILKQHGLRVEELEAGEYRWNIMWLMEQIKKGNDGLLISLPHLGYTIINTKKQLRSYRMKLTCANKRISWIQQAIKVLEEYHE